MDDILERLKHNNDLRLSPIQLMRLYHILLVQDSEDTYAQDLLKEIEYQCKYWY